MSLCLLEVCCAPVLCMHYSTACASERNWSARGQLRTKHRSHLALERAKKFIYVRNGKQFTKNDLEASLQLLEEENKWK
eukprot:1160237-Pelagomonas_calceolata.AAC.7